MKQGRKESLRAIQLTGEKWDKLIVKLADNFSNDPLKLWSQNGLNAILVLKDLGTIIRTRNITYTIVIVDEFEKQIPELLGKGLISGSYNDHSSPAFMVINHAEKIRGKTQIVIDYRQLNQDTKDDGYKIPTTRDLIDRVSLG